MTSNYPRETHFIDSSVFVSVIKSDRYELVADRYLSRVRNGVYKAYVSPLVLGEILTIVYRDMKTFNEKYDAVSKILILLEKCDIFVPVTESYFNILSKFKHLSHRCSSTDIRIVSEAVNSQASKLVTLDKKYNTEDLKGEIAVVDLHDLL